VNREKRYYLVREDILPEAIRKTAWVKEMLANGSAESIKQAVEMADLARSTFYKYKDGVYPFFDGKAMQVVNLSLHLKDRPGILSGVLNSIAGAGINILTINQSLPLQGMANVTLSLDMEKVELSPEELIEQLYSLDGVIRVEVVGRS